MSIIRTGNTSAYQVSVSEFNGKRYLGIAKMFCTKNDPTWRVSRNHIGFCVESKDDVKSLIAVMKAVKQELIDNELVPQKNGTK